MAPSEASKRKRRRTALHKYLMPLFEKHPCTPSAQQAILLCHEAFVQQCAQEYVDAKNNPRHMESSILREWILPAQEIAVEAQKQACQTAARSHKPSPEELLRAQEELLAASQRKMANPPTILLEK